jgi:glycosyltransferase involved in cell wall biosynthesis
VRIYLDNIIFSLQRAGGISAYWGELCQRLHDCTESFFIEDQGAELNVFRKEFHLPHRRVLRTGVLPVGLKRYMPDVRILPEGSIFHTSYYRPHFQPRVANVVTVYDFIYEFYRRGLPKLVHRIQKWFAIKRADGIICISASTFNDLKRLYPKLTYKRSVVIPLAASDNYRVMQESHADGVDLPERERIILFVGDRMLYKNFRLAVQTVSRLPAYRLWVVGKALSDGEARYTRFHLGHRWDLFENIESDQLNSLFNRAFCLLYPSEYEGFGIPILEAMQAGCPVVTTGRSSLEEVVGSAALIAPDKTAEAFSRSIRQLEDECRRQKIISAGVGQARKFSWDRCADETLKFYGEVLRTKFGTSRKGV